MIGYTFHQGKYLAIIYKFLSEITSDISLNWALHVAQMVKNLPAVQETQVQSLGWEDRLEKEMATHSRILPGKSHGQRSLVDCSQWGHKESGMTEPLTHTQKNHKQKKLLIHLFQIYCI